MKLIKKVKASPDSNTYAYWFEVNQEEAEELKKDEVLLFFTPHFKGNKTFDQSFNFKSDNILQYLGDKIFFIQIIREDDIKKYGVEEYDIQPLHIKKIWDTFDEDECYYKECERIKKEFEKVLYTCKYSSDGVIFDIKPMEVMLFYLPKKEELKKNTTVAYRDANGDFSKISTISEIKEDENGFTLYMVENSTGTRTSDQFRFLKN